MTKCKICQCEFNYIRIFNVSKKIEEKVFTDKVTEVKCSQCENLLYGTVTPIQMPSG